jgi:alpha-1,3-rhamnosyltransferase
MSGQGKVRMRSEPTTGLCSVICVSYNHAAYCESGLQSIFDQKYRNIEIVVIDDGSTDETVAILQAKLNACPFPSKLISQTNTGNVGLNYNRGMDAASGEYISMLSLDDMLMADCLSSKIEQLYGNAEMVFAANSTCKEIGSDGLIVNDSFQYPIHDKACETAAQLLEVEYQNVGSFYVQSSVFRRDILESVGRFDTSMTGDDLILRTRIFQHMVRHPDMTFTLLRQPGFLYRKHDQNLHRNILRQLRTVMEWRKAYFPDRPLPDSFTGWTYHYFRDCLARNQSAEITKAISDHPELGPFFENYKLTWKYRRKSATRFLRRLFGLKSRAVSKA